MQRQRALADSALAGAHGHEMTYPCEPIGNPRALLGNLLEDSGASIADDVVVTLHFVDIPALRRCSGSLEPFRRARFDSLHRRAEATQDELRIRTAACSLNI